MRNDCWLRLSLFGGAALARLSPPQAPQVLPLCTQSRNLLVCLALARGGTRSRSQLAQALSNAEAEPAPAASLSSALWRLRCTLESPPFKAGDLLTKKGDGQVGLRTDAPLHIDVESYLQLVLPVLALPLEAVDAAATEQLRRGAALYVGDLLPGALDDWVLREREKLRHHQLNALGRLVSLSVRANDAAAGVRYAEAILDIDELREDVHRDLMRLLLLAGQRAQALRQYERCRLVLRRELSIVPMPETQALYRQIVAGAVSEHAGAPTLPTPPWVELLGDARRHLAAADAQLLRALPRP